MIHPRQLLFALSIALLLGAACATVSPPPADAGSNTASPSATKASRAQEEMTPTASSIAESSVSDATTTDPDKYQLVMENERVRVLRYHDVPGTRTHQHRHPDSVLYALSTFRRRLHFPDGTTRDREFQNGDVMWIPAQTHVGENIGTTDTEVLLVEVKTP
jgi:quercetin dioxygenase-like cupin family protein